MLPRTTNLLASLLIALITLSHTACGGGGGGDSLSTNSCSTIGLGPRIINGTNCTAGSSAVVPITLFNRDGSSGLCSGTMLTDNDVLTAAHCFLLSDVVVAVVTVGGRDITGKRATLHPSVRRDVGNPSILLNDVAIIQLKESVDTPTLPLLSSRALVPGDVFSIFGYGLDDGDNVGALRSGEMRTDAVTNDHINSMYEGEGSNTCNGDSGGPALLTFRNGNGTAQTGIVGVVSSGSRSDCREGDLSIFTNAQSRTNLDFILSIVPDAEVI